jgi:type II secretory pathway component PulC
MKMTLLVTTLFIATAAPAWACKPSRPAEEKPAAAAPAPAQAVARQSLAHWSKSARIVPDAAGGFRLYGVQPDGDIGRLGLQNGDLIKTVNGLGLRSPEEALQVYAQLRHAKQLEIGLERDGKPMVHVVRLP